ncbi:hypothetical protein L249_0709 [Ophiocordyceps polyrhachis-furcata BCC 54312]|uniref:Uncharacterized protein n=1 Tax=Ophiocordyceps polyrhachis-furcata BCC 54312 TaxID=1330021 RepID=A0A367LEK8_9HYPO|nr:hypothetical protein L249_0709 [Ophiocordyceps polyrhachis-furcata BCC 54312]
MGRNFTTATSLTKLDLGAQILQYLPGHLLREHASDDVGSKGRNTLRYSINEISKDAKRKQEIEQLAKWIFEHRTPGKRICWPKHETWEILSSYKNMLDGLQNLFVSEDSLRYGLSARFARQYPKPIDPDKPYCINASSPYYTDVTRVIAIVTEENFDSSDMRSYLNVFQHPFLHALAAASQDEYECSAAYGCTSHLSYGQPMFPDSFDHLWATVVQAFAFKLPLCMVFSDVPDLNPGYVYVMGGADV